jgi:hypothetical protein
MADQRLRLFHHGADGNMILSPRVHGFAKEHRQSSARLFA